MVDPSTVISASLKAIEMILKVANLKKHANTLVTKLRQVKATLNRLHYWAEKGDGRNADGNIREDLVDALSGFDALLNDIMHKVNLTNKKQWSKTVIEVVWKADMIKELDDKVNTEIHHLSFFMTTVNFVASKNNQDGQPAWSNLSRRSTTTLVGEDDSAGDSGDGGRLTKSASSSPRILQDTSPMPSPTLIQRAWTEELDTSKGKRSTMKPFLRKFRSESTVLLEEETKQLKLLGHLSEAALKGHVADVELLIANGANLKFKPTISKLGIMAPIPLLDAIRANYLPVVRELLKHGADPNVFDEETGLPCLALAWILHRDNTAMFDTLLRHGAFPQAIFVSSLLPTAPWTIVHEMAFAADPFLLYIKDRLIRNNDEANFSVDAGPTPLQAACLGPKSDDNAIRIKIVNMLIEQGANVKAPCEDYTDIIPALCKENAADLIQILLEHGADPNAHGQKKSKCSALHLACEVGNPELVQLLLASGADLEYKDENNKAPILYAIAEGHLDLVKLLVNEPHNAKLDNRALNRDTALHIACASPECTLELVKFLIESGVYKYDEKNNQKQLGIHHAAAAGHLEVVIYLSGLDKTTIDAQDEDDKTPLHCAVLGKHIDIVKQLIQDGAEVDVQSKTGYNPLHYAAELGDIDIAHFLKQQKLRTTEQNKEGNTPFMLVGLWWTEESQLLSQPAEWRFNRAKELLKCLIDEDTDLSTRNKKKKKAKTIITDFKERVEKASVEEPEGLPVYIQGWDQLRGELLTQCAELQTILTKGSSALGQKILKPVFKPMLKAVADLDKDNQFRKAVSDLTETVTEYVDTRDGSVSLFAKSDNQIAQK